MMGMRNTFKVLFYIKKTAPLRNGNVPIMGRITINGQCTQFATQLSVQPELWNVSFSCVMGRSALATRINEQLTRIRLRIELCYNMTDPLKTGIFRFPDITTHVPIKVFYPESVIFAASD